MDEETYESFCDCIGGAGSPDPTTRAFCYGTSTRARTTVDDPVDLNTAFMNEDE